MSTLSAERPSDFALLLPPGWVRLPVGAAARPVVARIVSARFGDLPPGAREQARRGLRQQILALIDDAEKAGGIEVLLCVDPIAGRAVSASCLITFVSGPDRELDFAALLAVLVGEGEQWRPVEVAGAMAARRAVRETVTEGAEGLTTARVDYLVPVPSSSAQLLLSFATVTDQVAAELSSLFDAIGGSLRWVYGG